MLLKITWLKDNEPLQAKTKFKPHYDNYTNFASLKIDNARPADEGTYICVAQNVVGKDQTSADGVVLKTPNIDERSNIDPEKYLLKRIPENHNELPADKENFKAPLVIEPLSNFKVYEGDDHTLVCKIDGYPKPKVFSSEYLCFFVN